MRIIVTVLANILVILIRSTVKDPIQLDVDSALIGDFSGLDYLRSETTQNLVNFISICLLPLVVQGFIRF